MKQVLQRGRRTLSSFLVKVPATTQLLKQSTLKFYADNPRVYSVVRANGKVPTQDEIQEQLSELDDVRELRDEILRNGGLLEPLTVRDVSHSDR